MSEFLRPRNIIAGFVLLGVSVWGGGEVADYYGQRAGEAARHEIEKTDIADQQYNRLRQLLEDEDLRTLLEQKLRDDEIDMDWLVETVITMGQDDE